MTSIAIRTVLLINTTSRLTRDTPITKPSDSESNSGRISRVATDTFVTLPNQDHTVSSRGTAESGFNYDRRQDQTNRQLRELSRVFRARL